MSLFTFGKKKTKNTEPECCGGSCGCDGDCSCEDGNTGCSCDNGNTDCNCNEVGIDAKKEEGIIIDETSAKVSGNEEAQGLVAMDKTISVKVLGSGCDKCNRLEAAAKEALDELGIDTEIIHVTDFTQIAAYGVMSTPALVVDEKVVSYGKVLKRQEVIALLQKVRG